MFTQGFWKVATKRSTALRTAGRLYDRAGLSSNLFSDAIRSTRTGIDYYGARHKMLHDRRKFKNLMDLIENRDAGYAATGKKLPQWSKE